MLCVLFASRMAWLVPPKYKDTQTESERKRTNESVNDTRNPGVICECKLGAAQCNLICFRLSDITGTFGTVDVIKLRTLY
jgi:hypothetical protein